MASAAQGRNPASAPSFVVRDPEFAAKAADVIGLYLSPPQNALVLSVDEKPSIQALERKTGYVCTSRGKVVRGLKSTCKRHGTINLFAALNAATGEIKSKTTHTKKRLDFQTFMEELVVDIPDHRQSLLECIGHFRHCIINENWNNR